jgi:hypothetical protein
MCDFFEVMATTGEGSGESLSCLPVGAREPILADAGYCSVAGIEHVRQHGADVLVCVNPQSLVAYPVSFATFPPQATQSPRGDRAVRRMK